MNYADVFFGNAVTLNHAESVQYAVQSVQAFMQAAKKAGFR